MTLGLAVGHFIWAVGNNRLEIAALGARVWSAYLWAQQLLNLNDCEVFLSRRRWHRLRDAGGRAEAASCPSAHPVPAETPPPPPRRLVRVREAKWEQVVSHRPVQGESLSKAKLFTVAKRREHPTRPAAGPAGHTGGWCSAPKRKGVPARAATWASLGDFGHNEPAPRRVRFTEPEGGVDCGLQARGLVAGECSVGTVLEGVAAQRAHGQLTFSGAYVGKPRLQCVGVLGAPQSVHPGAQIPGVPTLEPRPLVPPAPEPRPSDPGRFVKKTGWPRQGTACLAAARPWAPGGRWLLWCPPPGRGLAPVRAPDRPPCARP